MSKQPIRCHRCKVSKVYKYDLCKRHYIAKLEMEGYVDLEEQMNKIKRLLRVCP